MTARIMGSAAGPFAILISALLIPAALSAEQDTFERAFAVPGHGTLRLEVPAMWRTTVSDPSGGAPLTIEFAPISGSGFLMLVTPIGGLLKEESRNDPEANRRVVEEWGLEHLERAVEEELPIFPIEVAGGSGHGARLTESDPGPDEFRVVTFGSITIGDLRVVFTILTHSDRHPAIEDGLAMIAGARHTARAPRPLTGSLPPETAPPASIGTPGAPGSAPPAAVLRRLTFPGRSWSLVLNLPGFEFTGRETREDGKGIRVSGENAETHLSIMISIEEAAREGDELACRKYYWKKTRRKGAKKTDVRLSEREGIALVEYLIEEARGFVVNQKNVSACLSHDGMWIEVQISKLGFRVEEWPLFEEVLRSIRIADDS